MDLELSIDIDAAPERVWSVMADVERWPEWTSSMTRVERLDDGPFRLGCTARVKQPRMKELVWKVTDIEPGRQFAWRARGMGADTLALHRIEPRPTGGSSVTLRLEQKGPLVPLMAPMLRRVALRSMRTEAEGLKRRSETGAVSA